MIPSCKKELINAQAHSLLLAADVSDFPLSIAPIMKAMKIMLGYRLIFVTYSTLAEAKHTDIDGICLDMASNDARVIYDSAQDIFYVYYNDTLPKSRVSQQASYYYACYLTKAPVLHVDKKLIAPFLPYLQRIVDTYDGAAIQVLRDQYGQEFDRCRVRYKYPERSWSTSKPELVGDIMARAFGAQENKGYA
ncbi:hypothetical protein [Phascolarctobacterium succinatutens]|uniref:hypothetical protein n=1 Tax=Phascolarctobacterium succinatutens TaxID=626940 RepID=UPI003079D30E